MGWRLQDLVVWWACPGLRISDLGLRVSDLGLRDLELRV